MVDLYLITLARELRNFALLSIQKRPYVIRRQCGIGATRLGNWLSYRRCQWR